MWVEIHVWCAMHVLSGAGKICGLLMFCLKSFVIPDKFTMCLSLSFATLVMLNKVSNYFSITIFVMNDTLTFVTVDRFMWLTFLGALYHRLCFGKYCWYLFNIQICKKQQSFVIERCVLHRVFIYLYLCWCYKIVSHNVVMSWFRSGAQTFTVTMPAVAKFVIVVIKKKRHFQRKKVHATCPTLQGSLPSLTSILYNQWLFWDRRCQIFCLSPTLT